MAKPEKHVFVCSQSRPQGHPRGCCTQRGSQDVLQAFWQAMQERNLYEKFAVTFSGCLGPCDGGVNVVVYPEGVLYANVTRDKVGRIIEEHLLGGKAVEAYLAPAGVW